MGSVKKKPLAAMDRDQQEQDDKAGTQQKKKSKDTKPVAERKRPEVLAPKGSDQELAKTLTSLKAITVYGAAHSLGVNAAVASGILSSLESKGMLRKVGGFSGHYVWAVAS